MEVSSLLMLVYGVLCVVTLLNVDDFPMLVSCRYSSMYSTIS